MRTNQKLPGGRAPEPPKKSRWLKNTIFYTIIILLALMIYAAVQPTNRLEEISFSNLVSKVEDGKVAKIVENGAELTITVNGKDGKAEKTPTLESPIPSGASASEQGLDSS